MGLGRKQYENKQKINGLYFSSSIKNILSPDDCKEVKKDQSLLSRKKNDKELAMNRIMYASNLASLIGNPDPSVVPGAPMPTYT